MILCCGKSDVCPITSVTKLLACRTLLVASGYQNRGWPLSGASSCYLLSAESSKPSSFRFMKGPFCMWYLTDASSD